MFRQDQLKLRSQVLNEERTLNSYGIRNNDSLTLQQEKRDAPGSGMESRAKDLLKGMPSNSDYLKDLGRKGRESQLGDPPSSRHRSSDYLKELGRKGMQSQIDETPSTASRSGDYLAQSARRSDYLREGAQKPIRQLSSRLPADDAPKKGDYLKDLGTKKTKQKGASAPTNPKSSAPSREDLAPELLGDDTPEALRRRAKGKAKSKIPWPAHAKMQVNPASLPSIRGVLI